MGDCGSGPRRDHKGAARRLTLFARRARGDELGGQQQRDMHGTWGWPCDSGEPYLADMVAATAASIHGVLGITPTWDRLEVTPHLPADWPRAEADILYKGRRHHVTIENGKVQIQPLEQVLDLPLLWVMDFNLRTVPAGQATVANVDFLGPYGSAVALQKIADRGPSKTGAVAAYVASGSYQSPLYDWGVAARLTNLTVAAELHGGR